MRAWPTAKTKTGGPDWPQQDGALDDFLGDASVDGGRGYSNGSTLSRDKERRCAHLLAKKRNRPLNSKIQLTNCGAASIIDDMVTMSRKQREIKQREAQILKLARPILLRDGYQG